MSKHMYENISEVVYSETLDNGLKVHILPKKQMNKTYGLFTTDYGSIDQTFVPIGETKEITVPNGIAHFLEHKLFEKEDHDVFADFGKQGASTNAYTSFTKTAYLFSATDHIEKNVQTLIDFVQAPYFSDQSVEKEKGIIGQEIKMYDDQADWQSFMGTIKAMFKKHPVNIDIAGTIESIAEITKEDLYTCYNTFYHPTNMTLFIIGNIEPQKMMDFIQSNQAHKRFTKATEIRRSYPQEQAAVATKESKIMMPVTVPKCTVGIKNYGQEIDKNTYLKTDLIQNMLLDHYFSNGGPFYEQLYNDQLIDESFSLSTQLEKNFGYSLIGGNAEQPEAFANKIISLLQSTRTAHLTNEEFQTVKRKNIGQLLRGMNNLEYIANQYTHYDMLGIDFFKLIEEIASLELDDVNGFLQNWITEDNLAVCNIVAEK